MKLKTIWDLKLDDKRLIEFVKFANEYAKTPYDIEDKNVMASFKDSLCESFESGWDQSSWEMPRHESKDGNPHRFDFDWTDEEVVASSCGEEEEVLVSCECGLRECSECNSSNWNDSKDKVAGLILKKHAKENF